jgi:hypothetical protein
VGARISSYPSGVQATALEALGAVPTDEFVQEGMDPPVDGFETMWWTYQERELWQVGRFVTANTALWPRTAVLVADLETMAEFDDRQAGWVEEAAADAATWSLEHADDRVADHLQTACDAGARIALADEAQRSALRAAAAPVYDRMRSDPGLAPTLARVEELVASVGEPVDPEIPDGCRFRPGEDDGQLSAPQPLTGPGDSGDFPQGSYRTTVSADLLRDAGASSEDVRNNAGVWTWTLKGGRWSSHQVPDDPSVTTVDCEGFYDVDGQRVTFTTVTQVAGGTCAPPTMVAVFERSGDGVVWTAASIDGRPDPGFMTGFNGDGWTFVS